MENRIKIMACVLFAILCISSYAQDSMGKYGTENGYTVQKLTRTSLYKVERNRLYGVVDSVGNVIVPVEYRKIYTSVGHLKNGEHVIYAENWKGYEGAFLSNGRQLLQCKYTSISDDYDFYTKVINGYEVERGNYKGYCDLDGRTIISPSVYTAVRSDKDGFYVRVGGDWGFCGFVDKSGKEIIPPDKYSNVYSFGFGYYCCQLNGKSVLCDEKGKELFRTNYTGLSRAVHNGQKCLETFLGDQRGLIDLKGNVIVPITPRVYERKHDDSGFVYYDVIDKDGRMGIKDAGGNVLIPCAYDYVYYSNMDNLFRVKKNEYEGVISKNGEVLIPIGKYHDIVKHKDGFAVWHADSKGFCDLAGKEVLPVGLYNDITPAGDCFYVTKGDFKGVVDFNGNIVVRVKYTKVSSNTYYGKKYYDVYLYDKKGLCDTQGKEIIPPIYDGIGQTAFIKPFDVVFKVKSGKRQGLVDGATGRLIFPAENFDNVDILPYVVKDGYYISASTGTHKCTYDLEGRLLSDSEVDKQWNEAFERGHLYFEQEEYLKAADAYLRAANIRKDEIAYFNVGVSYYNVQRYSAAIDNFECCLRMNPSSNIRDKAVDLTKKSRYWLDKKSEEKRQNICSVIGGFLNIGLSILQSTQMRNKRQAHLNSPVSGIYDDDLDSADADINVPRNKTWRCTKCGANRTECLVCNGEGHYFSTGFGIPREVKCEHCNGTKICPQSR